MNCKTNAAWLILSLYYLPVSAFFSCLYFPVSSSCFLCAWMGMKNIGICRSKKYNLENTEKKLRKIFEKTAERSRPSRDMLPALKMLSGSRVNQSKTVSAKRLSAFSRIRSTVNSAKNRAYSLVRSWWLIVGEKCECVWTKKRLFRRRGNSQFEKRWRDMCFCEYKSENSPMSMIVLSMNMLSWNKLQPALKLRFLGGRFVSFLSVVMCIIG